MQHRRSILQGDVPDLDPRLLRRRRANYRLMINKLAASEVDLISDATLYGIVAAGVAEYRLNGSKAANKHFEAGLTLWEMQRRKGMCQQITYPMVLIFCDAYISIGVEKFFKSYAALARTGLAMVPRLKSMQAWNRDTF